MRPFFFTLLAALLVLFFLRDTFSSGTPPASGEDQTQPSVKYWIFFKDKGPAALAKGAAALEQAKSRLSARALQRRAKVAPQQLVDATDVDVYEPYLRELAALGLTPVTVSRWLNAVSVVATPAQMAAVRQLASVAAVQPVARLRTPPVQTAAPPPQSRHKPATPHRYAYGTSLTQMEQIRATDLHDAGITGRGVLVGMLDTGFRWQEHEAFQHLKHRVLGERDFIRNDGVTRNQTGDPPGQDSHGTETLSVLAGFKEGQLIGPAFDAEFLFAKTENIASETHAEEDFWVAAIEWMEQLGVEVTSTSLGYSTFDAGQTSYSPADMDGRTTIITKAAEIAASKGVIVVNSAGNEGNSSWRIITAPADGPNVIAVGAVDAGGTVVGFSSRGPSADGRLKPDVMAMGIGVQSALVGAPNSYGFVSGTSFSCPLTAGVVAQILSAHPEITPQQMMRVLHNTASRAATPDNDYGYGIVNARAAITAFGPAFSNLPEINATNGELRVTIRILSRDGLVPGSVRVWYAGRGRTDYRSVTLTPLDSTAFTGLIPKPASDTAHFQIHFTAEDSGFGQVTYPRKSPQGDFLVRGDGTLEVGDRPSHPPESFVLEQNRPNPFRVAAGSTTVIGFTLSAAAPVQLRIYNTLGQEVRTLLSAPREAGRSEISWDGRDSSGRLLASGVYFYVISTPQATARKKLLLLR
ncbi:MAG: S8 family serine peptidase [candidate division KSB1 bacterium]|nr:S8 family serine peptidase [candidate division KSB1 bacterium]MDZ7408606.1 S8 family serine peptidase [candidate division KSB1 bacterium]